MLSLHLHNNGYIFGVDEAGRGSWAGPMTICALAAPGGWGPDWVKDSKAFNTLEARKQAFEYLQQDMSLYWCVRWVSPKRIDEIGLNNAEKEEIQKAVSVLFHIIHPFDDGYPERIIIDGSWPDLIEGAENVIDADATVPAVMAASMVAKVNHDDYMLMLHSLNKYNMYGFDSHMGYGTKEHKAALEQHGVSDVHRQSFSPIRKIMLEHGIQEEYLRLNESARPVYEDATSTATTKLTYRNGRSASVRGDKIGRRPPKIRTKSSLSGGE
jgi:ribonuclease HII